MSNPVILAFGGNLATADGDARATVARAMSEVAEAGVEVIAQSRLYATPCFPAGAGPDYVNAAVMGETGLGPDDLLAALHAIERAHGRVRADRWAGRTLDIDIIAMGSLVHPDRDTFLAWHGLSLDEQKTRTPEQLVIPHPRLQDRGFVLVPVAEIAPGWRHPVLGRTIAEMLAALPADGRAGIRAL